MDHYQILNKELAELSTALQDFSGITQIQLGNVHLQPETTKPCKQLPMSRGK